MKPQARTAVLLVVAALACSGCVKAPDVQLVSVRLAGVGVRGATLVVELSVHNPNRFAIQTDSVSLLLESTNASQAGTWSRVTSATDTIRNRFEPGTTTMRFPVEFSYSRLGAPIGALLDKGTLRYRISGEVFVRRPLHWKVPYSSSGSVSL